MAMTTNTEFLAALMTLLEERVRGIVREELENFKGHDFQEVRNLVADEIDARIEQHTRDYDHDDFVRDEELKDAVKEVYDELRPEEDTLREDLLAVFRDAVNALEN